MAYGAMMGNSEDHLIDFAVAVAADAEDGVFYPIQHGKDFFRIIVFRQIVSRSVVEDVTEENELMKPSADKLRGDGGIIKPSREYLTR